ncbi:flagellar biosynthesis protein FliO, partial [Bradyrhizobium sp. CSA112]|uniref:flagellar biosynthetic protein FliO n=1 Tax=Bradyrhizobium sp. CSA112 TaxID=2699170 RepID=UPI0023AF6938
MQTLTFLFAFIAVLALIGVAAWLVRRFANNRLGASTQRGRMPRLAVIDAAAVDGRRRLVLVRRDNVEHLLMIGGPSDIVVEPNIVRAMPNRDQMAPRPAVGEQPPRIAPLPDAAWSDEAAREAARSDLRPTEAFDHHTEPQMPEPPPRPARPSFADEIRRPASPPMPERRSDPLTGFAPESISGRPEAAPPRLTRNEPLMPRPQRELPKPPPVREAPSVREAPPVREAMPAREAPPIREAQAIREASARAPER